MATYGYIRASTAQQIASPAVQKQLIADYCHRAGLNLGGRFFVDPSTSGKINIQERPAGGEMMAGLKSGDHIVVARLDRLTRSLANFANLLEILENRGIALHACDMPGIVLDPANPIARMLMQLLVVFGEFERKIMATRIREGFAAMKREGHVAGPFARYGWSLRKRYNHRLKKDLNYEVPNPDERRLLMKMVELRTQGLSHEDIALYINNKLRIRTRLGKEWSQSSISRVLCNAYEILSIHESFSDNKKEISPMYQPEEEPEYVEVSDILEDDLDDDDYEE
jgi:DNA invertase Pin-like site-specific DNA recombinase